MIKEFKKILRENQNSQQAKSMADYMKNKFAFAGIPKPELKKLISPVLKQCNKDPIDWQLVRDLWNEDFREAQYIALEYLEKHKKQITSSDLENLKYLIVNKSWWETVDTIDGFVGQAVMLDEKLKSVMLEWAYSDNIWLRRVSIDFQQKYKDKTDSDLLAKIIELNFNSDEFFINKAIGWSLRDYAKVNPKWVKEFVEKNKTNLSALSIKEALKGM